MHSAGESNKHVGMHAYCERYIVEFNDHRSQYLPNIYTCGGWILFWTSGHQKLQPLISRGLNLIIIIRQIFDNY